MCSTTPDDLDLIPSLRGLEAVVDYAASLGVEVTPWGVRRATVDGTIEYCLIGNKGRHFTRRAVREWLKGMAR